MSKYNHRPSDKALRRLLRALAQKGSFLREDDRQGWRPGTAKGGAVTLTFAAELVEFAHDNELIQRDGAHFVLSDIGRMSLRRLLAGADPFAEQHQQRKIRKRRIGGEMETNLVNDASTPLGWLARRRDKQGEPMISALQFEAGERLARDFQFAGLQARITSSWAPPGTSGQKRSAPGTGIEISDNRLAAQQRVRNMVADLGPELGGLLLDICCYQKGLRDVEAARHWPRRSGKVILQIALDRLIDHYGMKPRPQRQRDHGRILHWGDEGYRPSEVRLTK